MPNRSNPFADIEQFFERMNQSFGDVGMTPNLHQMAVDVAETDTEIVVTADLPGFEKDDITIAVADRDLTIEAARDEAFEAEEGDDTRYVRRERTHQELTRTVRLPDAVEESAASASYRNGVLTVTLPREVVEDDDDSTQIDIE